MRTKGFTLIELMIVIAVIAIIAAIAIPGLLRARITANESSAIGTLRSVHTSQFQFQNQAVLDQDVDGTGEFGVLNELAGNVLTRLDENGEQREIDPPFISSELAPNDIQIDKASKSGYIFQIFLPSSSGSALTDNGTIAIPPESDSVVIDLQEQKFRLYAWPGNFESTGIRVFAVQEIGEVLASPNSANGGAVFEGATSPAQFDSAVEAGASSGPDIFDGNFKIGVTSESGLIWVAAG